jgi:hypothetical protein
MRKNILTTAFILGSFGVWAGSEFTIGNTIMVESASGRQIEIMILEEKAEEDLPEYILSLQKELSTRVTNHEETLRILNKIRQPETEVKEELVF